MNAGSTDAVEQADETAAVPASGETAEEQGDFWTRHGWHAAAWAVLVLAALITLIPVATHQLSENPVVGDQASHLLQALSLAYDGHSLEFDAQDIQRFREADWRPDPAGLFFQQYDGGYAFAKPYGYSLYLAPFIAVLGAVPGVAVANVVLILLLAAGMILVLRTRFRGSAVPLTVTAFLFASYAYMYGYVVHTELFLATLVFAIFATALQARRAGRMRWALTCVALAAFAVTEKAAFLPLVAPLLLLVWLDSPTRRARIVLPLVGLATVAVAVLPYLHYSDWKSVTPYGGERFYATDAVPFSGDRGRSLAGVTPLTDAAEIADLNVLKDPAARLDAAGFYFIGRHTGMLPFIPVAALLLAAVALRVRRLDRWAWMALLGIAGYIAFYVLLFPRNFYGGGQSLGNRYFLQIAPAVLVLAVMAPVSGRVLRGTAIAGVLLGLIFLAPHHRAPDKAYLYLPVESNAMGLLPFEGDLTYSGAFACPPKASC